MIKINFQEPDTENWKNWLKQCQDTQKTHNEAIEAGQVSNVDGRIYKGEAYNIKPDFYMNLDGPFHGKCAYCESLIKADQPGDIEHFRPKNAVVDGNSDTVMDDGYYWLAYIYQNLLPSCRDCNKIPKKGDPKRYGKGNQFPVRNFRAARPGDERREEPLLINPVFEDPELHLEYDENGYLHASSDMGQACINIFGFEIRQALVDSRKETYKQARDLVGLVMVSVMNNYPDKKDRLDRFWKIWDGHIPYSAAGRAAIKNRLPGSTLKLLLELYKILLENE